MSIQIPVLSVYSQKESPEIYFWQKQDVFVHVENYQLKDECPWKEIAQRCQFFIRRIHFIDSTVLQIESSFSKHTTVYRPDAL